MKIKIPHWAIKFALSIADLESFGDTSKPDMRMYEYSWALSKLIRQPVGKLLDIGCTASLNMIPATMCRLGWEVYGLDIRDFQFKHPNFHFVKEIPDIKFDAITAISSLEHFGISGRYGIQKTDLGIAREVVVKATELLNPDGIFLVTVPFTRGTVQIANSMVTYNESAIAKLMSPLNLSWNFKTIDKDITAMVEGIKC